MSDDIVKFSKKSGSSLIKAMQENPGKAGSILVKLATQSVDVKFTQQVVDRVAELVKHGQMLELALQKTQKEIELNEARLSAIEAGEFEVDGYGKILFNDFTLRLG